MRALVSIAVVGIYLIGGCGQQEKVEPPRPVLPPPSPSTLPAEDGANTATSETPAAQPTEESPEEKASDLTVEDPGANASSDGAVAEGKKAGVSEAEGAAEMDAPGAKPTKEGETKAGPDSAADASADEVATEEAVKEGADPSGEDGLPNEDVDNIDREGMSSLQECTEALDSLIANAKTLELEEPNDVEKEEFLLQCSGWPQASSGCLAAAQAPNEILECMRPIAKYELEKSRTRAIEEGDDLERVLNERIKSGK